MPENIIIKLRERLHVEAPARASEFSPGCDYIAMRARAKYARRVHSLRIACEKDSDSIQPMFTLNDGSQIYRPLSFREVIQALVTDYNTLLNKNGNKRNLEDRLKLFNREIDSCTGVAYKAGTSKFKIIPVCEELITIKESFEGWSLPICYDNITGIKLDSNKGRYNVPLAKKQVLGHEGWLTAMEEDKDLLKEYANIVFSLLKEKYKRTDGIGFWVSSNTRKDELRALFVDNLNINSLANGNCNLNYYGSFLRVARRKIFSTGNGGK